MLTDSESGLPYLSLVQVDTIMECTCESVHHDFLSEQEIQRSIDLSGNAESHGVSTQQQTYWRRKEHSEILLKAKDREFVAILRSFIPQFRKEEWNSELLEVVFHRHRQDGEKLRCICGQFIYNICVIRHIPSGTCFQVGLDCIEKIDKALYKEMLACKKASKKRIEEARVLAWKRANDLLMEQHRRRQQTRFNHLFQIRHFSRMKMMNDIYLDQIRNRYRRVIGSLNHYFNHRACSTCYDRVISNTEPAWKINCITCHMRLNSRKILTRSTFKK
jgi:hypothetical protein